MSWRGVPLPALILLAVAAVMLGPAGMAAFHADRPGPRAFVHGAGLTAIAGLGLHFALRNRRPGSAARAELLTILFLFAVAPAAAAIPVAVLAPGAGPFGAWFEMVSTFTTTGGGTLADPGPSPRAMRLHRAATAWFGGLGTLVAAAAILAPRNLGGYEVEIDAREGPVGRLGFAPRWAGGRGRGTDADARLSRAVGAIAPVYAAMTAALALIFASIGVPPLSAVAQAMGVMSTSGIGAEGGSALLVGGRWAEAAALVFMAAAASRHSFTAGGPAARASRFARDPELELAAIAVGLAAGFMMLRHWLAAATPLDETYSAIADAAWGAIFTCVSFLTTTGYVSAGWEAARYWSGLETPGLLLLGLAAMGGGVASTAGGVKLLRSFALWQHGLREMATLASPSAALGRGTAGRRVGRAGAVLAWVFVMLFLLSVGATALGLAATGQPLDRALAAAIASLANAGPAYEMATGDEGGFAAMTPAARAILSAAMIVGRVETLVVVALLNPEYWRR